ncbi:hypothetical protein DFH09DRAFT_1325584 [Mycena vulgaris]|nr:hypothetical protein DFH09DRAFT_1325584 [Mycena vulgaris]
MSPAFNSLPDHTGAFVDEGYLQLVELLGSGGYVKVYKALDTTSSFDDSMSYAVKCLLNGAPGSRDVSILQNEFRMHRDVSASSCSITSSPAAATARDMLHSVVKRHLYVDRPALITEAFMEVLDAVEQTSSATPWRPGIRLADFGTAKREDESQIFKCGTLAFMSPECADSTPLNRVFYSPRESDLWALAVILFTPLPWGVADLSDPNPPRRGGPAHAQPLGALLLELVHSRAPQWPPCALCRVSSAGLGTPSLFIGSAPSSTAIGDLLDAANVGLAMLLPPFVPTKLHTHSFSSTSSSIVLLLPPPVEMAPEYRFLGHKKRNIATRQRFADKLCRVY